MSDRLVGVHSAGEQSSELGAGRFGRDRQRLHGELNDAGVNAIRALAGRGLRILGARMLSSDPDWRFLNVRRLFIMIERTLRLATAGPCSSRLVDHAPRCISR
jgi:phage tail sheath protein FI